MKFATLKSEDSRDGKLCLVSKDLQRAVKLDSLVPNLLTLMERWEQHKPELEFINSQLNSGGFPTEFKVEASKFHSSLPRTWLFADGSSFIHHIKLVRKARNAALPETLETVPLMYQAESTFLAWNDGIPQVDFSHGTDFEAEVGVITQDVPMGISAEAALKKIALVVLINDVSLRGLIPAELAQGFGFFQSKPAKALSWVAVTPDELGSHWRDGRLHLPLMVELNGKIFGQANAGEMHFHFGQLMAHAAKTRSLPAGTLIGSGTVSNDREDVGSSCLVEKRTIEQIQTGNATTPFMKVGDRIRIWMNDEKSQKIFGEINQTVVKA